MYKCSPPYHYPFIGALHILTYYMYAYTDTCTHIICLPQVLNMHVCCAVPTLAPKDRDRCAFFPLGCTSLGFWMLKDFDAAMITSAARSMPTVGWTDTHTYVRTHVRDHTLQPCMYICVYTTSPILTHKVQYLYAYTRNSLYLSLQHTLYKCMYCTYVRIYI